ncbi:MAG: FAD-dependent oxidoreductase [Elusimicrobia bacterium]|nr:FAD-dependent oxidoreductase [Elusimicrobiota bacterium]
MAERSDVLVIGGGFAGLSCAAALAEGGAKVTLLEKKPHLGGRAFSFKDSKTGETVDNGQHLFMGCYWETRKFLKRIGSEHLLSFPRDVRVAYADTAGRRTVLNCPSWLPAPLHLAFGIARLGGISWGDRAGLGRFDRYMRQHALNGGLPTDLDRMTVRAWLDSLGQSRRIQERLFDPIALGALNELPEQASALGFVQVLREIFYRGQESSRLGLSTVGLSELYVEQARAFFESRGGKVLTGRKIVKIGAAAGSAVDVTTDLGETFTAGSFVVAVPHGALKALERPRAIHGDWETLGATPILGINLWLDREVVAEPVTGLLGTEIHWVFNKNRLWNRRKEGQYLSLVISGAHQRAGASPKELFDLAAAEMSRCFPGFEKAKITAWSVIKEPYATPSPVCGTDALRPPHATALSNLFLAGDWTGTGLPATIESAVASGHRSAELVLRGAA